ncbi:MAG: acyltransferase family protein [Alphaproteobacteria bacterium]|nr:acyltransferase family protein [Alphaproteobacteria bacterium]
MIDTLKKHTTNLSPFYRPDIDGLRAVAILLVIGFHFFPNLFPCGFLGVDIFFVISGYIITDLILREIQNNTFSFAHFYRRRVNRLFPTMLLVFTLFIVYGWFVLLPNEFKQMCGNIFFGSLSLANYFSYREVQYFDPGADFKPFLHLWSLSVEEQFYLTFPLFFVLAHKIAPKKKIYLSMILVGCISFYLSARGLRNNSFTFFSPITRCWELLLGCILPFLNTEYLSVKFKQAYSVGGALLITGSMFMLDPVQLYPGWRAAFPTMGAALIILGGKDATVNKRILSNASLVFIGLVSYTWYLIHWPFIAVSRIINQDLSSDWKYKVFMIMLTFILSILIYLFWERKIRYAKKNYTKHLLACMGCITLLSCLIYNDKIKTYASYQIKDFHVIAAAIDEWDYPDQTLIPLPYKDRVFFEIGDSNDKVLFLGDSNMEQYAPRISSLIHQNPNMFKEAYFVTQGGTAPIPSIYDDGHKNIIGFMDAALTFINDNTDITDIVICAAWTSYLGGESSYYYQAADKHVGLSSKEGLDLAYKSLENMLATFVQNGKKVHLILSMPSGQECDPKYFIERNFLSVKKVKRDGCKSSTWINRAEPVMKKLREIAKRHGINVIDPTDFLCDSAKCITEINGTPVYKDSGHLRPSFVKEHIKFLDGIIKK